MTKKAKVLTKEMVSAFCATDGDSGPRATPQRSDNNPRGKLSITRETKERTTKN